VSNFFIADENVLSKQKMKKILRAKIILRNRALKTAKYQIRDYNKKVILCSNYKPFLKTYVKGFHISLFYDKILSNIPKNQVETVSCHNKIEILKAKRLLKPRYIMISPIFITKTHKDAKPLGVLKLFRMINDVNARFITLGGVDEKRFQRLKKLDFKNKLKGFAGIRNFLLT
jgi:thiamine monophosphate synthase